MQQQPVNHKPVQKPVKASRRPVYAELLFLAGLLLISFGITLMVHADLGISVASSVPYVISLRFQQISFGTWSYIVQGFLVFLLVLIVRRIRLSYVLSFVVSVAFGLLIDLFAVWTADLAGSVLPVRALLFLSGLAILSLGIALFVFSQLPLLPYDLFVKELAAHFKITFRRCKILFDISCLAFSSLFLLLAVHRLSGIGVGSLAAAMLNGTMAGFWLNYMGRHWTLRRLTGARQAGDGQ